jgi:hypothetical protein
MSGDFISWVVITESFDKLTHPVSFMQTMAIDDHKKFCYMVLNNKRIVFDDNAIYRLKFGEEVTKKDMENSLKEVK